MNKKLSKEEFRTLFPECTAFADEVRKIFGDGVKMVYAKENGLEVGRRPDPHEKGVNIRDLDFTPLVKPGEKPEQNKGRRRGR